MSKEVYEVQVSAILASLIRIEEKLNPMDLNINQIALDVQSLKTVKEERDSQFSLTK